MKKLLALLLCLIIGLPLPLIAQTFPPIAVTGPEIPGNNYDDDGDGITDEIPATSIVVDANAAGNYHWHFRNCEKVTYENVADDTFPDKFRVEKPAGSTIIEGEIVCYIPNLPAATYTLHVQYSTPAGTQAIWPGVNKSLRYQMKPEEASILPFTTTPQWQALVYTGTAKNYYAGENGGDLISFVWPGGSFAIAFKSDVVRLACGYLSIGAEPVRTCPGETGTPLLADYELYELGKATVPTAYNSAAFANAKTMQFSGTETGSVCGGTLTVKGLWQNTTTDRQFWSIVCNDTSAVTANTTNDFALTGNEDQFDLRWRANLSAVTDTDTYMVVGNLHPAYFDADWSGVNNARNTATSLNTTVVRNINAGVSWNMFIAADLGSNVVPDTFGLCQAALIDTDADVSTSVKYFKGSSNSTSQWGVCKWLSTAVPVSGDTTAPVVTSPAIPSGSVEQTSFIMTANTNEDGVCRVRYGTSSGVYGALTPGTPSVNGVCTVSVTSLTAGQTYYADMQVCDAAPNCGDSTEVSTKTSLPAVGGCTHYAGPTAQGTQNGSSDANRYLINGFWVSKHAVPGAVLCLASGTYTGISSMIQPPASLKGNKLAPITIRASVDGAVLIDGQGARRPVQLVNDNDWWVLEGFNARHSNVSVIAIRANSDDNVVRRVCAWDASTTSNDHVWNLGSNSKRNLLEDVCGFGSGRKIFSVAQGGTSEGITIRRAWASFTGPGYTGPNSAFNIAYDAGNNLRLENVIGTWKMANPTDYGSTCCRTVFSISGEGGGHEVLGSMAYIKTGDNGVPFWGFQKVDNEGTILKDVIVYAETTVKPFNVLNSDPPCATCAQLINSTEIGGGTSSIGSAVIVTNRVDLASIGSMTESTNPFRPTGHNTDGNGARMCFRYVDGQLTTTKLWPWPMDDRINAALALDGRNSNDYFGTGNTLTQFIESKFGTIPSGCKS